MNLKTQNHISYLTCPALEKKGFSHSFSTRVGGVSPLPSGDLNLAFKDDKPEFVKENRKRFLSALKKPNGTITTAHQTHSDKAIWIPSPPQIEPDADALITINKNFFIGVKTADCLPLLLGDPSSGLCLAIHAGWRGTLKRITEKTLQSAQKKGLDPKQTIAALGPAACVNCYEVGSEVVEAFKNEFKETKDFFQQNKTTNKNHFNVKKANYLQLIAMGLQEDNIFESAHCTIHQADLFFSYRRDSKKGPSIGRQLSLIGRF